MSASKKPKITGISTAMGYSTLEAPAYIGKKESKLFIGIPKDTTKLEKRVPLTPSAVSVLVTNGHRIVIESHAGDESHFYDRDYSEAGAEVVEDKGIVYKAQMVVKVSPPTMEEVKIMQHDQCLFSPIQLSTLESDLVEDFGRKGITALAFELFKDDSGSYPFVRSMSEIAGSTAILVASEYLSHLYHGKGVLLGGISGVAPSKVVVLGAGVVGEFATRTAMGLGATVKVFDNNIYKLMRLQNHIGTRIFSSVIDPDILIRELSTAEVAVGAIHSTSGRTPVIISEQMVSQMQPGSIIVDVSIDQGGCFETSEVTTHENPTFKKYGVIHYCVPNIPSRVSMTASMAISNILYPMLLKTSQQGGIDRLLHNSFSARRGVYMYKGRLTNEFIGEKFGMKYIDLDLLFTSET